MSNFEARNDTNYAIPIVATNAAGGIVPLPSPDTFSVSDSTGSDQGLLTIGTMPDGVTPALLINAAGHGLVSGVVATVSDSSGLAPCMLTIDVVADTTAVDLSLNLPAAVATFVPPASS
jgi:hypothetical protein